MKNMIYDGVIGPCTTDCDGDDFWPKVEVTEEVNGYMLWEHSLELGSPRQRVIEWSWNKSELLERAVARVLEYRYMASLQSRKTGEDALA